MRPPRLAEAPHQRRVARLEEDQHRVEPRHLPQPPEDLRETTTGSSLRGRRRRWRPSRCRRRAQRQLRQRRDQRGRQVVDAEVAEILERADRLRLPRPGQAGQDDERLRPRRAAARVALAGAACAGRLRRGAPGLIASSSAARASSSSVVGVGRGASRSVLLEPRRRARAPRDARAPAAADCAPRPRRGWRRCGRARPACGSAARAGRASRRTRRRARAARTRAPGSQRSSCTTSSTRFDERVDATPNRSLTLMTPRPRSSM